MLQPRSRRFEATYRVRYGECNAYGRVHHANYLRYMQETAFGASADAGYDLNRYNAIRRLWLIRQTVIDFHHFPLSFGDTVSVTTWVDYFQRVRSRRCYALRDAATGAPIADAFTDWVFIDMDRMRPTAIPDELIAAFFPNGHPSADDIPPRETFPTPPEAPPGVFTLRRRPEWRDIDGAQHVNNAMYIVYLEEASLLSQQAFDWPLARLIELGGGTLPRRYWIEYRQPAVLGDELEIATWCSDVNTTSGLTHQTITRVSDGALLVQAQVAWDWVDFATRQPIPIPTAFLDDLAKLIVPNSV